MAGEEISAIYYDAQFEPLPERMSRALAHTSKSCRRLLAKMATTDTKYWGGMRHVGNEARLGKLLRCKRIA